MLSPWSFVDVPMFLLGMVEARSVNLQPLIPLKRFDIFSSLTGMLKRSRRVLIFL